jgi:hypothetical protein
MGVPVLVLKVAVELDPLTESQIVPLVPEGLAALVQLPPALVQVPPFVTFQFQLVGAALAEVIISPRAATSPNAAMALLITPLGSDRLESGSVIRLPRGKLLQVCRLVRFRMLVVVWFMVGFLFGGGRWDLGDQGWVIGDW